MKRALLQSLLPVLLCPCAAFAQSSSGLTVSLTEAVERIVSEEPTRLAGLRGELLANNPEAVDYESILKLQGADNCVISVFNTPGDTTACWKATLPAIDDLSPGWFLPCRQRRESGQQYRIHADAGRTGV